MRERSARSVPMGRNTGRSSFSGGTRTPDSLSDNEGTLPRPLRKGSAPPRSSLTPGQFISLICIEFVFMFLQLEKEGIEIQMSQEGTDVKISQEGIKIQISMKGTKVWMSQEGTKVQTS